MIEYIKGILTELDVNEDRIIAYKEKLAEVHSM